jgi:HEAT repeat protein
MTTADESISALIAEARSTDANLRLGAIRTLAKRGSAALLALPQFIQALSEQDPRTREAAAHAISECGPSATPALVRMLTHSDKYVRRHAVWGLSKLGRAAKPLISELCRALRDEDARTASGAAQAIGNMGEEGSPAIPALAEAMRGTNIVLCRLAAKSLSQIGAPALATLITHLKHHDPFVRGEAAVSLGWMGEKAAAAVQPLTELIRTNAAPKNGSQSGQPGYGTPSTTVAPVKAKTTTDTQIEETTRINAITALGRIGPDAMTALPYLQDALAEGSESIRRAAEVAIRQVQGVA